MTFKVLSTDPSKQRRELETLAPQGYRHPHLNAHGRIELVQDKVIESAESLALQIAQLSHPSRATGSSGCETVFRFATSAVAMIRELPHRGHLHGSQRELAGRILHTHSVKTPAGVVHILDVDGDPIHGDVEEVKVPRTRYSYHSHPHEAYERNRVTVAWPSMSDYMGYLYFGTNTIFHCVCAKEGLYIISFSEYWVDKLRYVNRDLIKRMYKISQKMDLTPEEYVSYVNSILHPPPPTSSFDALHPVFVVQFIRWEDAAKPFTIQYLKEHDNCFLSDSARRHSASSRRKSQST